MVYSLSKNMVRKIHIVHKYRRLTRRSVVSKTGSKKLAGQSAHILRIKLSGKTGKQIHEKRKSEIPYASELDRPTTYRPDEDRYHDGGLRRTQI